jgi:hypothetical protein
MSTAVMQNSNNRLNFTMLHNAAVELDADVSGSPSPRSQPYAESAKRKRAAWESSPESHARFADTVETAQDDDDMMQIDLTTFAGSSSGSSSPSSSHSLSSPLKQVRPPSPHPSRLNRTEPIPIPGSSTRVTSTTTTDTTARSGKAKRAALRDSAEKRRLEARRLQYPTSRIRPMYTSDDDADLYGATISDGDDVMDDDFVMSASATTSSRDRSNGKHLLDKELWRATPNRRGGSSSAGKNRHVNDDIDDDIDDDNNDSGINQKFSRAYPRRSLRFASKHVEWHSQSSVSSSSPLSVNDVEFSDYSDDSLLDMNDIADANGKYTELNPRGTVWRFG